jgi:hypothetical protein
MIEIMYYLLAVQDSGEAADGAISKSCCPGYNRAHFGLLLSSSSHFVCVCVCVCVLGTWMQICYKVSFLQGR